MKMLSACFLMAKVAVQKSDNWVERNLNQSPLYMLHPNSITVKKKLGSLWCTRLTRSTEKLIPIIETDSKTPCLIHSRHSGSLIKVRKTNPFSWEPKQMTRSNFL